MQFGPFWTRVLDNIGPGLFWGIWSFTLGWTAAVYCTAIPVDSAGAKLVAAIVGPACGAALAVLGALKVLRDSGRRDARRAAHQLKAKLSGLLNAIDQLLLRPGQTPEQLCSLLRVGKPLWLAHANTAIIGLNLADTPHTAEQFHRTSVLLHAFELMVSDEQHMAPADVLRRIEDLRVGMRVALQSWDKTLARI